MEIYTADQITEMADTWANYSGFSGESCGECHKTANVFAGGAGWMCDCGAYNVQSFSNYRIPHEKPDMGAPLAVIRAGHEGSAKWRRLKSMLTTPDDEVL